MKTDGKQLEALVAFVEARLLPRGFDVKSNERVFNDEGNQVAEFDIEIRGKVGSTSIAWLIECRDRPGHGAAPGSWIEQLVGRRTRFGFNKVTAVSTTGFAAGAIEFAEAQGIELREVRALDASEFCGWLQITSMQQVRRVTNLRHATFGIDPSASNSIKVAAMKALQKKQGNDRFLISTSTSEVATASEAFFAAVHELKDPFKHCCPVKSRTNSIG